MIHNGRQHVDRAMTLRELAKEYFAPYTNNTICEGDFDPVDDGERYPEGGRYDNGRLCFIEDHDFNTTLSGGPFPVGKNVFRNHTDPSSISVYCIGVLS
jgi:hypothetical protein